MYFTTQLFAGNQGNHQNFEKSLVPHKLWLIWVWMKQKKAVLALFWAYVRQPDDHIGWVTLMPFASINPTIPRTNPWNFGRNCSAFGEVEKKILLLHHHENKSQIMCYNGWDSIFNFMMVYSQKWGQESYNCMSVGALVHITKQPTVDYTPAVDTYCWWL